MWWRRKRWMGRKMRRREGGDESGCGGVERQNQNIRCIPCCK
jgi:hypothetical protein